MNFVDRGKGRVYVVPMIRSNYYLPKQMIDRLKEAKARTSLTVSELIRRAVEKLLQDMGL